MLSDKDILIVNQTKMRMMKYVYQILILMAGIISIVLVIGLIIIGLSSLYHGNTLPQTIPVSPGSTPAPRPTFTNAQIPPNQDPIIGSWLNGMVFYANGMVGTDGTTSWRVNENQNYSYFVISDIPDGEYKNTRIISTTEWLYNPVTDRINKRGSSEFFSRGIPKPTPKPTPAITTVQTQLTTTTLPGNGTQKKFSYSDCVNACKINYVADHNIGLYNDCLNTCNIENLK
jgi:hypothetical protein